MKINIKAKNAKLTPDAHEIIEEKLWSLKRYCRDSVIIADVEIGITTRHHQKGDIYRAEVNLEVPGKLIRAEAETDNITKSMNEVRDKLKAELKKYKEKNKK